MKLNPLPFLILLFVAPPSLHGQYTPMVEEGKFWIYLNHLESDHPQPISGHAITFEGDTIIGTLNYKKVYRLSLKGEHDCQFPPCFEFDIPYVTTGKGLIAFIREDTADRKVYNMPIHPYGFCDSTEHLIFDYALEIGDTLNACLYEFLGAKPEYLTPMGIVDSIKVTERYGKNRNTLFTTGVQHWGGLPLIGEVLILEGIGLENYGVFHEPLSFLVDFCEDSGEFCELLLSNVQIPNEKEVNIFPNPTNGILQVSIENESIKMIRIYSVLGDFIADFTNTTHVDISDLQMGVYFVELTLKNNNRIVNKIVKGN